MTAKELFDGVIAGNIPETDINNAIQHLTDDFNDNKIIRLKTDFDQYLQQHVLDVIHGLNNGGIAEKYLESVRNLDYGNLKFIEKYFDHTDFTSVQMASMLRFSRILLKLYSENFILQGLYDRQLTQSELFIEEVFSGKRTELEIYTQIKEFTDNFQEDQLNLFCEEFDKILSFKLDSWKLKFTKEEIQSECQKIKRSGEFIPLYVLPWGRRLYVSDFFRNDLTGKKKKSVRQNFERSILKSKRELIEFVDVWQLMSSHRHGFESGFRLRDMLVDLKTKHCSIVELHSDSETNQFYVKPLNWEKSTETLRQLIESLIQNKLIEKRDVDEIIQEHFSIDGNEPSKEPNPIKWLSDRRFLAYLMHRLGEEFLINISNNNKHHLSATHFIDSEGENLKISTLTSSLSKLRNNEPLKVKTVQIIEKIIRELPESNY